MKSEELLRLLRVAVMMNGSGETKTVSKRHAHCPEAVKLPSHG